MVKKITIHSFRGGTGKTNTSANVGTLLARAGMRVGVLDSDIRSPGLHVLFGLDRDDMKTLNDYIRRRCEIEEAAQDVTHTLGGNTSGRLYVVPCSINTREVARIFRDDSYDVSRISEGAGELVEALQLDVLIVDTHPGLNDETLLMLAISDTVGLLLRPDCQDYQGTSVSLEIAERLDVPRTLLIVNKSPELFSPQIVERKIGDAFGKQVAAVLPYSERMMALSSQSVFVLEYPQDPLTALFEQVAVQLMG